MNSVSFQRSDDYSLPRLTAADISRHQERYALMVLFGSHLSLALLLGFSPGAKHGGHSSDFSCGMLFVTF